MFSRNDFDELLTAGREPTISIYLPTHSAGREIRQDPIRLRNLLYSAAQRLAQSCRKPAIDTLLAPAEALIADGDFWRYQGQALAIFLAPGFSRVHKLPAPIPEEIIIGQDFYIRPLLPLLEDAGPFWLLTISAKHTRAYHGSRWEFREAADIDLPQGVGEIREMTQYDETHYARPVARRGALAHAQSFGESPKEVRHTELMEFLRRVAAAFEPRLKESPAPVILAAHPQIGGNFRKIAGWKEIMPEGIGENPDALAEDELHRRAIASVSAQIAEHRTSAVSRLKALLPAGKAITKPEEIIKAGRDGRVDTLFLGGNDHLWGRFDKAADRVIAHGSDGEEDIDLLNYAALMTLRNGGR
jgi:hypothetical protein